MGMYTEFRLDAYLRSDTPRGVIDLLKRMADVNDTRMLDDMSARELLSVNGDNPFFHTSRGSWIFFGTNGGKSDGFAPFVGFESDGRFRINVYSSIKDYDSEIEKFLDWIRPYLQPPDKGEVEIGFHHYEERIAPTNLVLDTRGTIYEIETESDFEGHDYGGFW